MGAFDDLIPAGAGKPAATQSKRRSTGAFDDLIPAGGRAASPKPRAKAAPEKPIRATDGMSATNRVRAGAGVSLVESWKGTKQAATEGVTSNALGAVAALEALGLDGAAETVRNRLAEPLMRSTAAQRNETTERRRLNADLLDTGAGRFGNVLGTIAQFVGPGGIAKAATKVPQLARAAPALSGVARALLPTTVRGGAIQGAAVGAAQPVARNGERSQNMLLGAGAGAAGGLLPRVAGTVGRSARAVVDPFTQKGQERIVGGTLRRVASDPARLNTPSPSAVPGVVRSLAEESQDPGIAQLQRQFPVEMADQATANNAARSAAIRGAFGGADSASEGALRGQAGQVAARTSRELRSARPPAFDQLRTALDAMTDNRAFRPEVKKTLDYVRTLAQQAPRNAEEAWQLRQTLGDLMEGRVGGDLQSSKLARKELMTLRYLLDREMRAVYPEWGQAMGAMRGLNRQADQVAVGRELLDPTGQMVDSMGNRMLTPAHLARASNDPDALVQSATGFRRGSADATLSAPQQNLLAALGEDASRMNTAATAGRAVGSPTAQNLATQNLLAQVLGGGKVANAALNTQWVQRVTTPMEKTYALFGVPERLRGVMTEALGDPVRAREMLARLPVDDRRAVEDALVQIGATLGSRAPAVFPATE